MVSGLKVSYDAARRHTHAPKAIELDQVDA
jgi:hypothetical protein